MNDPRKKPHDRLAFRIKCFRTLTELEKTIDDLKEAASSEPAYSRILLRGRAEELQKTGKLLRSPGLVVLGKELHSITEGSRDPQKRAWVSPDKHEVVVDHRKRIILANGDFCRGRLVAGKPEFLPLRLVGTST